MLSRYATAALLLALLASLIGSPRSAGAASINYGDFRGATLTFEGVTESSITDGLPLFGAPSPSGDSLSFAPQSFVSASAGGADTTSGTLSITLQANPGQFLQNIVVPSGSLWYAGPFPSFVDGTWTTSASIDLSGLGITRARIQLNNKLQSPSSTLEVGAQVRKDSVTITHTP